MTIKRVKRMQSGERVVAFGGRAAFELGWEGVHLECPLGGTGQHGPA